MEVVKMDSCSIQTAQSINLAAAALSSLIAPSLTQNELSIFIAFLNALTTNLATISVTGSTVCPQSSSQTSEAQQNSAEISSPGTSDIISGGNSNPTIGT